MRSISIRAIELVGLLTVLALADAAPTTQSDGALRTALDATAKSLRTDEARAILSRAASGLTSKDLKEYEHSIAILADLDSRELLLAVAQAQKPSSYRMCLAVERLGELAIMGDNKLAPTLIILLKNTKGDISGGSDSFELKYRYQAALINAMEKLHGRLDRRWKTPQFGEAHAFENEVRAYIETLEDD